MNPQRDPLSLERPKEKGRAGVLYVISAPSGAGKSTLCGEIRHRFPKMHYSVSRTTRAPRPGETHGVDYFFISREEFETGIAENRWAEWAKVHDNYYGTSARDIDAGLSSGKDILLDIDVQGARQIVKRYPGAVTIFIMPPSMEELRHRLESRATDSPQTIDKRLKNAVGEMAQRHEYRHIIINDDLKQAVDRLVALIASPKSGKTSNTGARQA